jgi:hypothetical protein
MKYALITHQYKNPSNWDEAQDTINCLKLFWRKGTYNCSVFSPEGNQLKAFSDRWPDAVDWFIHTDPVNIALEREDEYEFVLRQDGILGVLNLGTLCTLWCEDKITTREER